MRSERDANEALAARALETNIRYLPIPYQCAIECLGNEYANRTVDRCRELCELYAATHAGIAESEHHAMWTESACAIAVRRYHSYMAGMDDAPAKVAA
jgi:hypothetical protein